MLETFFQYSVTAFLKYKNKICIYCQFIIIIKLNLLLFNKSLLQRCNTFWMSFYDNTQREQKQKDSKYFELKYINIHKYNEKCYFTDETIVS